MAQRRKWSAAMKFEIVLLVLKGETTLSDICQRYAVAPSQVQAWKKQLLEHGAGVFSKAEKGTVRVADQERLQRQLYEKVGQLTMERDFLKKSWSTLPGNGEDN
jgi:transposase